MVVVVVISRFLKSEISWKEISLTISPNLLIFTSTLRRLRRSWISPHTRFRRESSEHFHFHLKKNDSQIRGFFLFFKTYIIRSEFRLRATSREWTPWANFQCDSRWLVYLKFTCYNRVRRTIEENHLLCFFSTTTTCWFNRRESSSILLEL